MVFHHLTEALSALLHHGHHAADAAATSHHVGDAAAPLGDAAAHLGDAHTVVHHDDPSGRELADHIIKHVDQVVYHHDPSIDRAGEEIANNALNHIDHVMYGTPETPHHEAQVAAEKKVLADIHQSHPLQFGAGTCSHCGGTGKTTWPSSGTVERCWYCSGSGVA